MAKATSVWFCSNCGTESAKWMGRCPACGEWNTMVEEPKTSKKSSLSREKSFLGKGESSAVKLNEISLNGESRISICNKEIERILGGGIVPGSLILLGGEPGIGKSTLSLQIPIMSKDLKTLYVSGEESPKQIKLRALRLMEGMHDSGVTGDNCIILGETLIENIIAKAKEIRPELMVVDSIQTIYTDTIDSSASSVSQVRECASLLLRFAKESNTPIIIIGHITKDGSIAGPKVLEHIVDVVLQFEGDSRQSHRILRSIKNRFGSTAEIAIFEMTGRGLREVANPSEILTPVHDESLSGIAVGSMLDGTRPFLIEIQSLVSTAAYGMPQRSATGFDARRLNMLLAVLEKRAGFKLSAKDVFLNIAGGLKVSDPACDLAVAAAILSSNFDEPISTKHCFAAEVGLSGEIRPVGQIERRISEAARLGYEKIFISAYNLSSDLRKKWMESGLDIIEIKDIAALCRNLFK